MKLVFFGGVQGVGKTTLISWLENEFKDRVAVLDPGELFRRYFYGKRAHSLKTTGEVEELITKKLIKMPKRSIVIVHWHYAVKRPYGYIPQIAFSRLKRIAESGRIEKAVFVTIEAPVNIIYLRRLRDLKKKERATSFASIKKEMRIDKEFLVKERRLFSKILGRRKIAVVRLNNEDLAEATRPLGKFFKPLFS